MGGALVTEAAALVLAARQLAKALASAEAAISRTMHASASDVPRPSA